MEGGRGKGNAALGGMEGCLGGGGLREAGLEERGGEVIGVDT